jgi:hypothetical protein
MQLCWDLQTQVLRQVPPLLLLLLLLLLNPTVNP